MNELVYGINPVRSILENDPKQILKIYIKKCGPSDIRLMTLINQIKQFGINSQECSSRYLEIKVKGALHQGIIAKVDQKLYFSEDNLLDLIAKCKDTPPLLLVLDRITDPHNLGACLRSANAAGVHAVIAPRNRAARLNNTVRKVASGAVGYIPFIRVTNLARTLRLLQENSIWVVGTVVQSDRLIFDSKLSGPLAVVMGSEDNGIRHLIKQICDELISIPTFGTVTSLNVSVATGICLFEVLRQRHRK